MNFESEQKWKDDSYQWVAFQYVCGELDSPVAEEFEQLLADNAEAQAALVEAVQLIGLTRRALRDESKKVSPAGGSPASRENQVSPWKQVAGYIGTVVAAAVAVILFGWIGSQWNQPGDVAQNPSLNVPEDTGQIANVWAASFDGETADLLDESNELSNASLSEVSLDSTDAESAWLVEALREFDSGSSPEGNSMTP